MVRKYDHRCHLNPATKGKSDYPANRASLCKPVVQYRNSNRLIFNPRWKSGPQKTEYIIEAGRCMVMQAIIDEHLIEMIFLDSKREIFT